MNRLPNLTKTFTITSQPFYDQYNQCYKNIMMVNLEPQGPISRLVRRLRLPRLSPFQRDGPCNPIQNCGLALQSLNGTEYGINSGQYTGCCNKYNSGCDLMTPDEIPGLISFLQSNGYQIETQITNMLNQSEIKLSNKRLAFTVTYYGANQPNIVYMR
jgi:hypothetical protein